MQSRRTQKLIQITDTHLFADSAAELKGVKPEFNLECVCRHILERHSDLELLLLTGDLSQDESMGSYERLSALVGALKIPAYALPGNHDDISHMRTVFTDSIRLEKSIALDHWNIHLLDSTVPGETGGELAQQELQWLQQQLESNPDTPCLIALHHPPLTIGSPWMDRIGLRNGRVLSALLHQFQQVRVVIFGHIHQLFEYQEGSIGWLGTPATCLQYKPGSQNYTLDNLGPGYRVLNLHANGTWESSVEFVNS